MLKLILMALAIIPAIANAEGLSRLKTFMQETRSGQASFEQVLLDKSGKTLQSAAGLMQFVRPGRFRWSYQKPYEQLIVGDGSRFWLYDVDLNQVTEKKLDNALGSSPAALLAGNNEIERNFVLKERGLISGLEWVSAVPRAQDTNFRQILLGFDQNGELAVMELHDTFEQITVLHFSHFKRNLTLNPKLFTFTPPQGSDVIGEE